MLGKIFGKLVVVATVPLAKGDYLKKWLVNCDCGVTRVIGQAALLGGQRSCGCLRLRKGKDHPNSTHGLYHTPEYPIWIGMKQRCYSPTDQNYVNYGLKGVTVCKTWKEDFQAFYAYVGPRPTPKHSLERENCFGNYEPGNVSWANRLTQANNRRDSFKYDYKGQLYSVTDLAILAGISRTTLYQRLRKRQFTVIDAVESSLRSRPTFRLEAIPVYNHKVNPNIK